MNIQSITINERHQDTYCMISFMLYRHKFLVYKDKITGILIRLTVSRGQRQRVEKAMATHSSVLAWRIPGTRSLVGCRLRGCTESGMTEATQQQQRQRKGFTTQGQDRAVWSDRNVSYVDCGGDEPTVYVCQDFLPHIN